MDFLRDKRAHLMPDTPQGGGSGGDDPYDHDDYLACCFKAALSQARSSSTAGTSELHDSVDQILKRVRAAGHFILVSQDLQPIAKRLLEIRGHSDKHNPDILVDKFKGFDLTPQP